MEGRKLQLAGKSTYLVSLPKRWVVSAGLKAGDTLFIENQADGTINVRSQPNERLAPRKKTFEETNVSNRDHLLRKLIGAYVSGFALIEVRFPADQGSFVRRVAREFCRLVIGPEIIEETRVNITIQDLSDTSELSSEKCLRRMELTVRAMLDEAVQAVKTTDPAKAQDVLQRGQDVSRLYWMVAKQFHVAQSGPSVPGDRTSASAAHSHRLIAKLLERVGNHALRIASTVPVLQGSRGLDLKVMKDISEATTEAISMLDRGFGALVTRDIDAANQVIDERETHQHLIDELIHRVSSRKGPELLALGTIVDSLGRTGSYAAEIAEQAIDLAVLMGEETT